MKLPAVDEFYEKSLRLQMSKEKLSEEVLKETIREYNINPNHRAWFVSPDGRMLGGLTHRSIIKENFKKDWEAMKDSDEEEYFILEIFEQRLIKTGSLKIGELNNIFCVTVLQFDDIEKAIIQGFVESLVKASKYNILRSRMTISTLSGNRIGNFSLNEILSGNPHSKKEEKNE